MSVDNGKDQSYNDEDTLAFVEEIADQELKKYFLLCSAEFNKIYSPYENNKIYTNRQYAKYDRNCPKWKFSFHETSKKAFDHYIEFLSTKNTIHFLLAEIEHLKYEQPYLEILKRGESI